MSLTFMEFFVISSPKGWGLFCLNLSMSEIETTPAPETPEV
jgi:hypothetical protein